MLPDVVLLVDPDRKIRYINRIETTHRMEDLIGADAVKAVAEDAREEVAALIDGVFETMEPAEHLTEVVGNDGESTWFEGVVIPVIRDGRAVAVAIVTKNVTTRREAERELELLRSLLPVCSWCKKVRTEEGAWRTLEAYLEETSRSRVTHGVCPDCEREMLPGEGLDSA